MSESLPAEGATPTPTVQVGATSVAQPAPNSGTTSNSPPAVVTEASPDVVSIEGMTPEQVDALAARIDAARKNRPPSLTEALASLEEKITGTHRQKEQAVETRKAASGEADAAVEAINELKTMMRRTELVEAATAAGFKAPTVVAGSLVGQEGDVTALIAEAAATGAWAMTQPAKSAPIGGPNTQVPAGMDPGMAALIEEVRQATGR